MRVIVTAIPTAPLPGFAAPLIRQQEAAAEFSGRALTNRLHQPGRRIDLAAAYMEVHSPLFAGSAANPQRSLFDDPTY